MSAPTPATPDALPASVRKVHAALQAAGITARIVMLADAARTSQQAADALGVDVARIAKSLVFRSTTSGTPVLVIANGRARVDEMKVGALIGEPIGRADPAFVREATGYAIGGIPPLAHARPMTVLLDGGLAAHATVWAAAGHPHSVFEIAPAALFAVSGGQVADVTVG